MQERRFTGFFISAELINDKRLNWTDRIVFSEINALETNEKPCYASNEHFAKMLDVSERCIRTSINKLKEFKYIKYEGFDGKNRYLRVVKQGGSKLPSMEVNFREGGSKLPDDTLYNSFENTSESVARTREANADYKNIVLGCSTDLTIEQQKERMNIIQKELINSNDFKERIARRFGLKKEAINELIVKFLNDIWAKEDFYKPLSDVKKHCVSWIGLKTERKAV